MNYYEHHIGDYAEATAHLSFIEDAAYSRLIRKYYAQEKAMPPDLKAVQRLVGARTKEEKDAVEVVLEEFFELREDGWHQTRCDEVIAKYLESQPEREAKKEAERERQRRTRERRRQLFEALRAHGIVPDFSATMTQLQDMLSRAESQGSSQGVTRDVTPPVTRDNTATQYPVTNTQSPVLKPGANTVSDDSQVGGVGPGPSAPTATAAEISLVMRRAGVLSQPADPRLMALAEQGVSLETVQAACDDARRTKPNEAVGPGYVVKIIERWAREAKKVNVAGARPPPAQSSTSSRDASRAAAANSIGLGARNHDPEPDTFDAKTGQRVD
ncbi:YdaU family protein [Herbaspirillum huttiense]|uniref:YdaU family protein n=1 Tax=Herbaspirillum huttiense TaxID=863372 RepID=UPI003F3D68CA